MTSFKENCFSKIGNLIKRGVKDDSKLQRNKEQQETSRNLRNNRGRRSGNRSLNHFPINPSHKETASFFVSASVFGSSVSR